MNRTFATGSCSQSWSRGGARSLSPPSLSLRERARVRVRRCDFSNPRTLILPAWPFSLSPSLSRWERGIQSAALWSIGRKERPVGATYGLVGRLYGAVGRTFMSVGTTYEPIGTTDGPVGRLFVSVGATCGHVGRLYVQVGATYVAVGVTFVSVGSADGFDEF